MNKYLAFWNIFTIFATFYTIDHPNELYKDFFIHIPDGLSYLWNG